MVTDTARHESIEIPIPLREPTGMVPSMFPTAPGFEPSPYWGDEIIFDAPANPHNPMMDARGRVWLTSTIRRRANPDWCREGSEHPSARYFPVRAQRPADIGLRPGDRDVHAHRQLLRHAPPAVRRRRARHPLVQRRPERGRLARHEAVRRERQRAGVAGLVPDRESTPTGTAGSRGRGTSRARRSTRRATRVWPGSPTASSPTRWTTPPGSPAPDRSPAGSSGSTGARTRRRRASPRSTSRRPSRTRMSTPRRQGTRRAASTSTATASSGPRCPAAGTWRASTAAGAAC